MSLLNNTLATGSADHGIRLYNMWLFSKKNYF